MASMHQITVPLFIKHLNGIAACIKKAQALYAEKKYDEGTLLSYRFYPDMFSFTRQIQAATGHALTCTAMLAGVEAPKMEDNEKSLGDLVQRIEKTNAWRYVVAKPRRGQNDPYPTNNPNTFDLWAEVVIRGRTNLIGNWKEE